MWLFLTKIDVDDASKAEQMTKKKKKKRKERRKEANYKLLLSLLMAKGKSKTGNSRGAAEATQISHQRSIRAEYQHQGDSSPFKDLICR